MSCCVFRFVLFAFEEQNKEIEKQEKQKKRRLRSISSVKRVGSGVETGLSY